MVGPDRAALGAGPGGGSHPRRAARHGSEGDRHGREAPARGGSAADGRAV
jgi:hypothetical protein